ncbi:MAG: hypothetical protein WKF75_12205 [Singulisphaera sp.]
MLTGKCTIHTGVTGNNDDLPASEVTIAEAQGSRLRHGPLRQVASRQGARAGLVGAGSPEGGRAGLHPPDGPGV